MYAIRWTGKTTFTDGTTSRYTMWLHARGGLMWCDKRSDAATFDTVAEARLAFNRYVDLRSRPVTERYEIVEL